MLSEALTTIVATVGTVLAGPVGPLSLPDHSVLSAYEPSQTSHVYAADGSLISEHFREDRTFVPVEQMPEMLILAFIASEDQDFLEHHGVDYAATLRAVAANVRFAATGSERLLGASTITQQVVKNLLLTRDVTLERKLREAILAVRLDADLTKGEIIEIYLNHIYLGQGAYGVSAAASAYFGKRLDELSLAEIAYLAGLPKAPSYYHPLRQTRSALARRAYVLDRMTEEGIITEQEAEAARAEPLDTVLGTDDEVVAARRGYYAESVRRELVRMYGDDTVLGGGLSVRVPMDPHLQDITDRALRAGLVDFDRRHGWRGPVATIPADVLPSLSEDGAGGEGTGEVPSAGPVIDPQTAVESGLSLRQALQSLGSGLIGGGRSASPDEPEDHRPAWQRALADIDTPPGAGSWRLAAVLSVADEGAVIGFADGGQGRLTLDGVRWARRTTAGGWLGPVPERVEDAVAAGDVVLVEHQSEGIDEVSDAYSLQQIPEVQGAVVAIDQWSGRVLAMSGGFSYGMSQFNRAIQALRQPGSAFKPFVYLAALERGYGPNTMLLDTPIALRPAGAPESWRPENYDGGHLGVIPLRVGIERSRNLATVRLLADIGIGPVAAVAERLRVYDEMPRHYSSGLGANVTSLLRLTAGYAMIANGGNLIEPSMIERVQDRDGNTIFTHDQRRCATCSGIGWSNQQTPSVDGFRPPFEQVLDPLNAYQMVTILQGVTVRGTAARLARLGLPLAGKTGTTNDSRDAWFIGFSPEMTVGVYVGYDDYRSLGNRETGSSAAVPIFGRIMEEAMPGQDHPTFVPPPGIDPALVASGFQRGGVHSTASPAGVAAAGASGMSGTGGLY